MKYPSNNKYNVSITLPAYETNIILDEIKYASNTKLKNTKQILQMLAQEIIDRYFSIEYFDMDKLIETINS